MERNINDSHYRSTSNILSTLNTNNENFLTHRLYKNHSQLRPDRKFCTSESQNTTRNVVDASVRAPTNLLVPFLKKHSAEESVLVPRITNRLRVSENSRELKLQIEKGKVTLAGSASTSCLNSSAITINRRLLFSKLDSLEAPASLLSYEEPSILDPKGDLSDSQESTARLKQRFKKHKKKSVKQSTRITSYENHNPAEKSEEDVLTPYDFIKLVTEDPDISDEFCYLRKLSHPYDLRIVDYEATTTDDTKPLSSKGHVSSIKHRSEHNVFNRKPVLPSKSECITISSRGITYFSKDESVFVTLEEWQREAELYQRLSQLNFFKDYKLWKNFLSWKRYLRRTAMKKVSDKLRDELLLADDQLRTTLLAARQETLRIETELKYFKIEESEKELPTAEQLKAEQDSYRANEFEQNLQSIKLGVKNLVVEACQHSLAEFKENQKRDMESRFKGDPKGYGEESAKMDHHYTDEATCKTHYKKLHRFIRLVDYMVVAGKLGMIMESTGNLRTRIAEKNADYYREVISSNEKYGYKGKQWFICELNFEETTKQLTFEPNRQRLRLIFDDLVTKGVTRVCKKHVMIADCPELECFRVQQEESEDRSEETFNIENLLHTNEQFREECRHLASEVEITFDYVDRYSKRLYAYLQIYFNNAAEDMDVYSNKDHNSIRKSIARWKQENAKLNGIIEEHEASIAMICTLRLKERIKNCAQDRLETLYRMLPSMLTGQTEQITQLMSLYSDEFRTKPKNVRQFIRFDENVKIIDGQLDDLSARISDISFLCAIIKENRNAIGEPVEGLKSKEARVVAAQKLLMGLRNTIHQANMDFSKTQADFRDEVRKMGPVLVKRVQALHNEILEYNLNSSERELQQNVDFLERCKKTLAEMFQESQQIGGFQKSLDMEITLQSELNSFNNFFSNLYELWTLKQQFAFFYEEISCKQFLTISVSEDESKFVELAKGLEAIVSRLADQNSQDSHFYDFTEKDDATLDSFNAQLKNFQPVMETLRHLNDTSLKEKEWLEIREVLVKATGDQALLLHREDPQYTVKFVIDKKLDTHCEFFGSVCIKAKKQQELIDTLKRVSTFWTTTVIACKPYKDYKDVHLLLPNEELFSKAEECRMELSLIYQSKYVECVQAEADRQSKLFSALEDLLSEWFKYQHNWLYLEPLFANNYFKVMKEQKLFTTADNNWRKIIKASKDFSAKKWVEFENAMTTLRTNNATFEVLKKMIEGMLEKKREVFPRLYLLSDGELIKLLSGYKDARSVQPFLPAIFESVQRFDFNVADKEIQRSDAPTGVVSFDQELLTLKSFRPSSEAEDCLKALDEAIKTSIRSSLKSCVNSLEKQSFQRKKWIQEHLSQAVVLAEIHQFTKLVETDFLASNPGQEVEYDLNDLPMLQMVQLSEIHEILQEPQQAVSRKLLYSLIVQSLANRDCAELLRREAVQYTTDFHWQQQLKIRFTNECFVVNVFKFDLAYGCEFLGMPERPILTPQTSRARLQIMLEIAQGNGFMATSSEEVVKDLAYVSGRAISFFDPAHSDAKPVLNMLRGACSTGTWLALTNISALEESALKEICHSIDVIRLALLKKEASCPIETISVNLAKELAIFNIAPSGCVSKEVSNRFRCIGQIEVDDSFLLFTHLEKYGLLDEAEDLSKDILTLLAACNEYFSSSGLKLTIGEMISIIDRSSHINRKGDKSIIVEGLVRELMREVTLFFRVTEKMTRKVFEEVQMTRYLNEQTANLSLSLKHQPHGRSVEKRTSVVLMERKEVDWGRLLAAHQIILVRAQQPWHFDSIAKRIGEGRSLLVLPNVLCSTHTALFGSCTPELLWKEGVLTSFMQRNEATNKIVVLEDAPKPIISFFVRAVKMGLFSLADGQKIKLDQNIRFIFVQSDTSHDNNNEIETVVEIGADQVKQMASAANVFSSFFSVGTGRCRLTSAQCDYLVELDAENSIKLLSATSKHITERSINMNNANILLNCCRNIKALLDTCEQPLSSINERGLQKLFAWGIFTAIYALLEDKSVSDRVCKSFAETLRLEHIKVNNLFEHTLSFCVPEGIFKPIEQRILAIPEQLSPHVEFIRMHMTASHPLVLLGKSGHLKSQTINIVSSLDESDTSTIIRVSPATTLEQFAETLQNKLALRKTSAGYCFDLANKLARRLSIFVDDANVNPSIVKFILRLTKLRMMWHRQQSVLASLSPNITIHMIFSGKAWFDPEVLNSGTHISLVFNESPASLLTSLYSRLLSKVFEESLLEKLINITASVAETNKELLNGHVLSKLYRAINHRQLPQRKDWCAEVVDAVCASKQSAIDKQRTTVQICSQFGVVPESLPSWQINFNLIRVWPCKRSWLLSDIKPFTRKQCVSLQSDEDWLEVIRKEDPALCVHLIGTSAQTMRHMNRIWQLLCSSADSQTHTRTTFVMDVDEQTYREIYQRYFGCIDRYFKVSLQEATTVEKLQTKIHASLKCQHLTDRLMEIYSSASKYIEIDELTLERALAEYTTLKSHEEARSSKLISELEACLNKYKEVIEKQRLLDLESEQNRSNHEAQLNEQAQFQSKVKLQTSTLNNLKRQMNEKRVQLVERQDEAKLQRSEDRAEEADRTERDCKELELKLAQLKEAIDAQVKMISSLEQSVDNCKKLELQLSGQHKSLEQKRSFIENAARLMALFHDDWEVSHQRTTKYLQEQMELCCLRRVVERHIVSLGASPRARKTLEALCLKGLETPEGPPEQAILSSEKVVKLGGGKPEAKLLLFCLLESGCPAKMYTRGEQIQAGTTLVVCEDELEASAGLDECLRWNCSRVYLLNPSFSGPTLPLEEPCTTLQKTVMKVLSPELYLPYTSNSCMLLDCKIASAQKKLQLVSALSQSSKCLLEDKQAMCLLERTSLQTASTDEHIVNAQREREQTASEFAVKHSSIVTMLMDFQASLRKWEQMECFKFDEAVFCQLCQKVLENVAMKERSWQLQTPIQARNDQAADEAKEQIQDAPVVKKQHSISSEAISKELLAVILQGVRPEHSALARLIFRLRQQKIPDWFLQTLVTHAHKKPSEEEFVEAITAVLFQKDCLDHLPNIARISKEAARIYRQENQQSFSPLENLLLAGLLHDSTLQQCIETFAPAQSSSASMILMLPESPITVVSIKNSLDRESFLLKIQLEAQAQSAQLKWISLAQPQSLADTLKEGCWWLAELAGQQQLKIIEEQIRLMKDRKLRLFLLVGEFQSCNLTSSLRFEECALMPQTILSEVVADFYNNLEPLYEQFNQSQREMLLAASLLIGWLRHRLEWLPINYPVLARTLTAVAREQNGQSWLNLVDAVNNFLLTTFPSKTQRSILEAVYSIAATVLDSCFLAETVQNEYGCMLSELVKLPLEQLKSQLKSKLATSLDLMKLGVSEHLIASLYQQRTRDILQMLARCQPSELQKKVVPVQQDRTQLISKCRAKLPTPIEFDPPASCFESIETVLVGEVTFLNKTIERITNKFAIIEASLSAGMILTSETATAIELLGKDILPPDFQVSKKATAVKYSHWAATLTKRAKFLQTVVDSKFKLRLLPLQRFLRPELILSRIVQLERRRMKLPNGLLYFRLLANQHEGTSDNSVCLSELYLQGCVHDSQKMCLEEQINSSLVMGPPMQLITAESLPANGVYVSIKVQQDVGGQRIDLMNAFVPTKKKHDESAEHQMALVIGCEQIQ